MDVRSTQSTSDPEVVNGISESIPGPLYGSNMIFFFVDLDFGRLASESIVRCVSPSFPINRLGGCIYECPIVFLYLHL